MRDGASERRACVAGGGWVLVARWSPLALLLACGPPATGGDGGSPGGTGGTPGGSGGAPAAGTSAIGGVAGSAGVSGTAGTSSGTGGGAGSGTGGSGASGGSPSGGSAGQAPGGAGGVAGSVGGGGASGSGPGGSGGAAGAGGSGNPGGSGGSGAAGCDVAVYDPADPPQIVNVSGSTATHDPVLIEASGRFYMFHTGAGMGLGAKTSTDFSVWQNASTVFPTNPSWVSSQVPGVSNLWAPDISYFGGQYHLYYSASTFGENRSCMGHATRAALDSGSWTDHGPVICSNVNSNDNWNAIDPNVVLDEAGMPWLSFGSFWSGIKMIPLDMTGARMGTEVLSLANRPNAGGALEAPFIVRRCGFYYLFVSWDRCCQGSNSTYNIRVGRAESVTGPYADKDGVAMAQGGGTLLVQGNDRWRGPGHNAVVFRGDAAYNVYHAYDANANGRVTLRISELAWDSDGWPISAGP